MVKGGGKTFVVSNARSFTKGESTPVIPKFVGLRDTAPKKPLPDGARGEVLNP